MKANTTLWIPPHIYTELMYYAWKVDAEVGGLGRLSFDKKENDIFIEEIYLLDQEVHQTECTLSAKGIALLYEELIEKNEAEKIGDINLWWHSHKNMGAFFSGQDKETTLDWSGGYLVSLVINRDGTMKACLMSRTPVTIVNEIDVYVNWFDIPNAEELGQSVDKKVRKAKFVPPVPKYSKKSINETYGLKDDEEADEWAELSSKSMHDMTEDEWDKAQALLDAEIEAWEEEELIESITT